MAGKRFPKRRKAWLTKPHRVIVTIDTSVGEITIPIAFSAEAQARECFNLLLHAYNVSGTSLIIKNKFAGARDGLGS